MSIVRDKLSVFLIIVGVLWIAGSCYLLKRSHEFSDSKAITNPTQSNTQQTQPNTVTPVKTN